MKIHYAHVHERQPGDLAVYIDKDAEGAWPKGARVVKVGSEPGDSHQNGATGAVVGSLGPFLISGAGPAVSLEPCHPGAAGAEYLYFVRWDDVNVPVGVMGRKLRRAE